MNRVKKYLTVWQIWVTIAIVLALLQLTKGFDLGAIAPFALLIICPLMMVFMMRGHKH